MCVDTSVPQSIFTTNLRPPATSQCRPDLAVAAAAPKAIVLDLPCDPHVDYKTAVGRGPVDCRRLRVRTAAGGGGRVFSRAGAAEWVTVSRRRRPCARRQGEGWRRGLGEVGDAWIAGKGAGVPWMPEHGSRRSTSSSRYRPSLPQPLLRSSLLFLLFILFQ